MRAATQSADWPLALRLNSLNAPIEIVSREETFAGRVSISTMAVEPGCCVISVSVIEKSQGWHIEQKIYAAKHLFCDGPIQALWISPLPPGGRVNASIACRRWRPEYSGAGRRKNRPKWIVMRFVGVGVLTRRF
jgi:hypothetical protein